MFSFAESPNTWSEGFDKLNGRVSPSSSAAAGVEHNGGGDESRDRVRRTSARFGLGVKHKDGELAVANAHRVVVMAVDANCHTFRYAILVLSA
jgi:hypothetical protein